MIESLPFGLQRLCLRLLRQDDLVNFHEYRRDSNVARFQGWEPMTIDDAAAFLDAHAHQTCTKPGAWHQLAIAAFDDDRLLGDVGIWLSPDCSKAEFGLSITPAAQGKGYGTECARGIIAFLLAATPVGEIIACTDSRNISCLAVLRRCGMFHVDTRQAEYKNELCVEDVFSLRRPYSLKADPKYLPRLNGE